MMRGRLVFLLGTQRSGTTWLANIFDSHPDCLHYYEPFSTDYHLFPYFPHEFTFLEPPAADLGARLRADLTRLERKRSVLFHPVHASRRQFTFEAAVAKRLARLYGRYGVRPLRFAAQFNLLHLNRIAQDPVLYFAKNDTPRVTAIKEVRLYFKAAWLASAFPEASFVHVVRHPGAVVSSMDAYLRRGRLVEMRRTIGQFVATTGAQPRLSKWQPVLSRVRENNLHDQLAAYWRVANEALEEQLAAVPGRTFALTYEDLATDPLARVAEMFAWCGLSMSSATEAYVRASSTSRSDRTTGLDTNRVSATYYRDWMAKAGPHVLGAVDRLCDDSPLMARFEPFYRKREDPTGVR